MIYKANEQIRMAVKTPGGLTERQIIRKCMLQGDTWGSLLASAQVDSIAKDVEEAGLGYLYKDSLSVSLLGLVDDVTGVTEAGFKAQQLNAILNVKSAEKGLQYGVKKCKSMLIGKNHENAINSELMVDEWTEKYVDNVETGEIEHVENYSGEVPIEKNKEYKYLGFIISCVGDNMANIKAIKDKSIGVIRTIMHKLEALNLERYYFECAMILMNVMLRGSILYASETYYNLTENQLRSIERIEEGFLRKILKTTKGCPIVQLYLETGQWPARFAIQKSRLLFLKTILAEDEQSMVSKFFYLQLQRPSRGDWASTCLKNIKNLKILNTLEEIKIMPKRTFLNLLQKSIRENALIYLLKKMGSKGSEMVYDSLEMADYLLPYNDRLKIEEKQTMFKIRNRMVEIGNNFGKKEDCFCCVKETMPIFILVNS